jgi:hypothetical protein
MCLRPVPSACNFRSCADRHEPHSREFEGHDVAITRWRTGQTRDIRDPGAGQHRNLEPGRFAGLSVEPQMWNDFLHEVSSPLKKRELVSAP